MAATENYYNPENDRSAAEVTYYLTEGQSGRKGISENYRYSSLSEDAGLSDDVPYPGAEITADNRLGIQYRDHVATMAGMQTAYDGKYAAMLVPYSVVASSDEQAEVADEEPDAGGKATYRGFAYDKFVNRFFTAKLRIEKLIQKPMRISFMTVHFSTYMRHPVMTVRVVREQ